MDKQLKPIHAQDPSNPSRRKRIWKIMGDLGCVFVSMGSVAAEIILVFAFLFCDDPIFCTPDKGLAQYRFLMILAACIPIIYILIWKKLRNHL